MARDPGSGQIITFYSFKGGAGRSMALANIACLLARRKRASEPVLMIDWDLEAPGLHRYFEKHVEGGTRPGLIDLFVELQALVRDRGLPAADVDRARHLVEACRPEEFITPTTIDGLHLLLAGSLDREYASKVNVFDWEGLFESAPGCFQALADYLATRYSYVLIDSRTGHTDIGGICTTLMPERLVGVFTPSRQSLDGLLAVLRDAIEYRRRSEDMRPLVVFPLPSRIENAEPDLRNAWRFGIESEGIDGYQKAFEELLIKSYELVRCDLNAYFSEVQVQHVPRFAYGEEISVLAESHSDRLSLSRSYEAFYDRLVLRAAPWAGAEEAERQGKRGRRSGSMVFGIDLGTTSSSIANVDEALEPKVIPSADGHLATPTVVYFDPSGGVVVGQRAKDRLVIDPDNTIPFVNRDLGTDCNFAHGDKSYSPQEIAALILRKLTSEAESTLGSEVRDVVLTVPSAFSQSQRWALVQAGELAGLNVLGLVPEPVAAVLAYTAEDPREQTILVFALRSGTFAVSLIRKAGGSCDVLRTGGDHCLGVIDWDRVLAKHLADRFCARTGVDSDELRRDRSAVQEILATAETMRMALTSLSSTTGFVRYGAHREEIEVDRAEFEELTCPLLERSIACTLNLVEGGRDAEEFDSLLLVGEGTLMPGVRARLEAALGLTAASLDPRQLTAKGAALYGAQLQTSGEETGAALHGEDARPVRVRNVASKSLGVLVAAAEGEETVRNLILRNEPLPAHATATFMTTIDGQESVRIELVENDEATSIASPAGAQHLGSVELVLDPPLPSGSPIELQVSLSEDDLLELRARDVGGQREVHAELTLDQSLSREQLQSVQRRLRSLKVI